MRSTMEPQVRHCSTPNLLRPPHEKRWRRRAANAEHAPHAPREHAARAHVRRNVPAHPAARPDSASAPRENRPDKTSPSSSPCPQNATSPASLSLTSLSPCSTVLAHYFLVPLFPRPLF